MKKRKLTEKECQVASDILCDYIVSHRDTFNVDFFNRVMSNYDLMKDPFTSFPCTSKEYAENSMEYSRQCMIEKYGHCDDLD